MLNLNTLNPQQRQAVETIHGPVLILAGAGTGKTRVITFRIAHMIERGVAPGTILGVTFTNKAAREMQERVLKLIPRNRKSPAKTAENKDQQPQRPTICTFHSLCVRILRQHIEKLGYKRNFVIYDESEQLGAMKKVLAQVSTKAEKADAAEVLGLISRLKNGGSRGVFFDPSERAMAQTLSRRYETALRACNAVDFDDLILLTLRLFAEHPVALEACRAKYHYVMVDEYQDTNASQFKLIHALTDQHRNLCVVGDDDQSIYGWRGAEISNLLDMEKHYPEVKVIKLEQNYRSTNTILNAANAVIKHNLKRRGKQLWSQKGDGPKISLQTFENEEIEAKTVVELIEFARVSKRVPWSDQAILFRTNMQSRPLETALRQANVRYHLIGGQSFFDRREIRDVLAYLKALINPNDDISLLRIANVPTRGLSDVTMERLISASQERKCSVFAAMKNPAVTVTFQSKTQESIDLFVQFIERTRGQLQSEALSRDPRALQTWAGHFLNEVGYFNEVRRSEKNPENADSRVRNLKDLLLGLDGNEPEAKMPWERLESFLEKVTLDNDREEEDQAPENAVTLITMHSCKGLEFPHVYIVGMEDGLLPHTRSKEEGTLDEERRLFYVAITRAKESLTISHCGGRKKYGQLVPGHPSPFLRDLPEDLVEHASEKARQPVTPQSGKDLFAAMRAALD
ncbi:MAG TPA: UvrD-helicase domain-containing protein [Clostridia bacterium]|nr:UvrD-helicase domain-containing protein [Clostridia bacterium]